MMSNFFRTSYKRHPNMEQTNKQTNLCHFGETVTINIRDSGDMSTCFRCKKIHRAFVHPDNYYNGNVCECDFCCPVIRITLPPLPPVQQ